MSTHERILRGYFAIQLDNGSVSDEEVDGIIAYIESVAGQTPQRTDTENHKPLSLADTKPDEQPKRREMWAVWRSDGRYFNHYQTEGMSRNAADDINGTYSLMREVLPGDPLPETIAETVAELRMVANCPPPASSKYFNAIADKLECK